VTIRSEARDYLIDPGSVPEGSVLAAALSDGWKEGETRTIDLRHRDPELVHFIVGLLRGRTMPLYVAPAVIRDIAGEASYLGLDALEAQLKGRLTEAERSIRGPPLVEFAFDGRLSPPGEGEQVKLDKMYCVRLRNVLIRSVAPVSRSADH